ncbi:hypothetical protein llap_1850 [Limosa lapponica baueri]|uniref:Uncharacterized protein n=1 Tax=Limosa lapponica baueri TaxID=1758121 RepID=A0A2I0UP91_LIMLA|nr:hypothetical protein llap_1850 [Limosa lapponica baueri]
MMGAAHLESSFAGKGLRVLGDNKMTMSQKWALEAKIGQQNSQLPKEDHCQQVDAGDPSSLLRTDEASSGVLGPVLGFSGKPRHGFIWVKVQHRAAKIIKILEHLSYGLRGLGLFSLE